VSDQVRYGAPLFTSGVFGLARAQDDLGVEEVGAGLLRRLIPGVIQNTPNAGYYSFYPYLLWKWEQIGGAIDRKSFIPFYRRHEAGFSVACALHQHRDGVELSGVNGALTARQRARELNGGIDELDIEGHAERYMDTPLGGYGLFYAVALQDARLVNGGASGLVDRVSEHGAAVARAFAHTFERTTYAQHYFDGAALVPSDVLRELGEAVCLCTVPGRSDHALLQETFFGEPLSSPAWEERRRVRIESLSLLLEFHAQRPTGAADDLAAWRRALIEPRFSDGTQWSSAHPERRESWRAYQLREIAVLALTTIWSLYVGELVARGRASRFELVAELRSWLSADRLGFDPSMRLGEAAEAAGDLLPDGYALAQDVELLPGSWRDERERALCVALRALLIIPREMARQVPGFTELLDEGRTYRWSLPYLREWLVARDPQPLDEAAGELLDALHHQHVRVALTKIRTPSAQNLRASPEPFRDPFNFTEDEGVLRPLRADEPFWTGARYGVGNHLLWSLGLLTSPTPATGLTDLGLATLRRHAGDA
jgi:hypothetical protein